MRITQNLSLLVCLGIPILFVISCSNSNSLSQKSASVQVVLSASKSSAQALGKRLLNDPTVFAALTGSGLDSGQYVSFTPTSFKMQISQVELFSEMVPVESEINGGLHDDYISGGHRLVIPINQEFDLMTGGDEINELLSKAIIANEEDFDTYIGVCLSVELSVRLSGSCTFKGKTYSFTDKEVFLNNPSFDYLIPPTSDMVVISDTVTSGVVLRLLLDVENCGVLSRYSGKWYNPGTENFVVDQDSTKVLTPWPIFMPYVGHTQPVLTRYRLIFPPDTSYHILLTVIGPSADIISAFGVIVNFGDSYNDRVSRSFTSFLPYQKPIITHNADGSWTIAHNPKYYPPSRDYGGLMKLDAFRLENHSGTITYNPGKGEPEETWQYTAEKL